MEMTFHGKITSKIKIFSIKNQLADRINVQIIETFRLLTSILSVHLTEDQTMIMNTSSAFMKLNKANFESIHNRTIEHIENARVHIPFNLTSNLSNDSIILLRVCFSLLNLCTFRIIFDFQSIIQPFASADKTQSNTNYSRLVSFSIFDQNNNEIAVRTTIDDPIELIILQDSNFVMPNMILQNVTSLNNVSHSELFDLKFINITNSLPVSIHFEIRPLKENLAYLFVYKFDPPSRLNYLFNQIDKWKLFSSQNLTDDNLFTYFIDNQRTIGHQSLIYGSRELNSTKIDDLCSHSSLTKPPMINEPFYFTSNYEIRIYTSGCYYLNSNNDWRSDGLTVRILRFH